MDLQKSSASNKIPYECKCPSMSAGCVTTLANLKGDDMLVCLLVVMLPQRAPIKMSLRVQKHQNYRN